MTVHNQLRRLGPIQRAVKIAFGLDAGEAGLERLSESIVVNRAIWDEPENAILRDERLCVGRAGAGAIAAQYTHITLSQMTAGWITIIERVALSSPSNQSVLVGWNATPVANARTTYGFRDNRLGTVTAPVTRVHAENNAVPIGNDTAVYRILANQCLQIEYPGVLAAYGTSWRALIVRAEAVNTELHATFYWRERPLLPGELDI